MIQLFSKPGCQPCRLVEAKLVESGLSYEKFDVSTNQWAMDVIKEHGALSVPVLLSFTHPPIMGFRPEEIKAVIKAYKAGENLDIEREGAE